MASAAEGVAILGSDALSRIDDMTMIPHFVNTNRSVLPSRYYLQIVVKLGNMFSSLELNNSFV